MAILGGIFGSLVDYDNGGVSSAARREYEIQKYADRAAEISNRKQVQSDRERIAQLEQELAQTKRALAVADALVKAFVAQRDMLRFELEAVCPKSPLLQDTGKVDEKGRPITFATKVWRDAFTRAIRARFGADANPATFHTAFRKE